VALEPGWREGGSRRGVLGGHKNTLDPPPPSLPAEPCRQCIAFEFIVKAHLVWHGFPCDPREFKHQSRAAMKAEAPYVAEVVYMLFDDGDWNPCLPKAPLPTHALVPCVWPESAVHSLALVRRRLIPRALDLDSVRGVAARAGAWVCASIVPVIRRSGRHAPPRPARRSAASGSARRSSVRRPPHSLTRVTSGLTSNHAPKHAIDRPR
jgi:hypothetical protein